MGGLPRWVGRAAALGLLLGVLAAIFAFGYLPVVSEFEAVDASTRDASDRLARYSRLAAARGALEAQLAALQRQLDTSGVYLAGENESLAAAEMQRRVKEAIKQGGGQVRSIQNLPTKVEDEFTRVSARVQFTGTISALQHVLHTIESVRPILFVENMDIKNRRSRRNLDETEEPVLTVRFDLYGYFRPEGP